MQLPGSKRNQANYARHCADLEVVAEASNGIDAIDVISEHKPDLVILDLTMPGMDGLEVTREVVKRKIPSRVLILTMHDSSQLANAVRRAGAHGYVGKTHAARDLVPAIRTILDGQTYFSTTPVKGSDRAPD